MKLIALLAIFAGVLAIACGGNDDAESAAPEVVHQDVAAALDGAEGDGVQLQGVQVQAVIEPIEFEGEELWTVSLHDGSEGITAWVPVDNIDFEPSTEDTVAIDGELHEGEDGLVVRAESVTRE